MDLALPDTAAARVAEETVRAWSPPALVHHCLRSYLFASWYGEHRGIAHDDELLRVRSAQADDRPRELRAAALEAYPALDLAEAFAARFEDQAGRKPESCAARAVRSGIAGRLQANRWGL